MPQAEKGGLLKSTQWPMSQRSLEQIGTMPQRHCHENSQYVTRRQPRLSSSTRVLAMATHYGTPVRTARQRVSTRGH